jgi:MFS family permease
LQLSYLEAGLGIGTLLGSLVIMILAKRQINRRMIVLSLFGTAILVILFSLVTSIPLLIVMAAAIGLAAMLSYLPLITFIQKQTEREKMGRVMSIITFASDGVEPLAFALIAVLMTMGVSIHSLLLTLGIGFFISAVVIVRRAKIFRQPRVK